MTTIPELFVEAEIEYRIERARQHNEVPRRHHVRRRPSLRLPRRKHRPLAVA
ncbi:MAG: hypothetical protein ACXVXM_16150 [Nocardioidaceae bacterium]